MNELDEQLTHLRPGDTPSDTISAIALDAAEMLAIVVPILAQLVRVPAIKNTDQGQRAYLHMIQLQSRFEAHQRALKEITGV